MGSLGVAAARALMAALHVGPHGPHRILSVKMNGMFSGIEKEFIPPSLAVILTAISNVGVETFDASYTAISRDGAPALAGFVLCSAATLTTMMISDCGIGNIGMNQIAVALLAAAALHPLPMSSLGAGRIAQPDMVAILGALRKCRALLVLDIGDSTNLGPDSTRALLDMIGHCTSSTTSTWTHELVATLLRGLQDADATHVGHLQLSNNELTDEILPVLAEYALASWLSKLELWENEIEDELLESFARDLIGNGVEVVCEDPSGADETFETKLVDVWTAYDTNLISKNVRELNALAAEPYHGDPTLKVLLAVAKAYVHPHDVAAATPAAAAVAQGAVVIGQNAPTPQTVPVPAGIGASTAANAMEIDQSTTTAGAKQETVEDVAEAVLNASTAAPVVPAEIHGAATAETQGKTDQAGDEQAVPFESADKQENAVHGIEAGAAAAVAAEMEEDEEMGASVGTAEEARMRESDQQQP
ncbi:hypothetical protein GGF32_009225 [Allomyces javanicus]|nr:hypothetical protein GGF32_009225 [Allomyces javanicus]